jgi:hypothetical protein
MEVEEGQPATGHEDDRAGKESGGTPNGRQGEPGDSAKSEKQAWLAKTALFKEERDRIVEERLQAKERRKAERAEKWQRRTRALSALEATGDVIADAEALCQAGELEPERLLEGDYAAFESGEPGPVLDRLEKIAEENIMATVATDELMTDCATEFRLALTRIIEVAGTQASTVPTTSR